MNQALLKPSLATLGLPAIAVALLGCGDQTPPTPRLETSVIAARVQVLDLDERIEISGALRARSRARVAAEVNGRVTEIRIEEGLSAAPGEVVLEIDRERRELERAAAAARAAEAGAALTEAEREMHRIRRLADREVASEAQLDQAETGLRLARARLESSRAALGVAERALRDASVAAPFGGVVAERLVSPGEYVNVGTPLYELVTLDPLEVEFHLSEKYSNRVSIGSPVSLSVAPFPSETFTARVSFVSPVIDERTRTLRIKAELENPDHRLQPGLFARIDLGVDRKHGVTMVPEEAILYRIDGPVLFRLAEGNRVSRQLVNVGTHLDGLVEITGGTLHEKDRVISRGHAELSDGSIVVLRNPDGSDVLTGIGSNRPAGTRQ